MISISTGVGVALIMSLVAAYKGRTGWHWFGLTLFAFATFVSLTVVALHFSNIRVSIAAADRELAAFNGAVTCAVILIILLAVPRRPKRRPDMPVESRRQSPLKTD